MPYLDESPNADCEVGASRRERQGIDPGPESEVVEDYPAGEVGKNCSAILIDRKKEVSAWIKGEPRDVAAVREGECV